MTTRKGSRKKSTQKYNRKRSPRSTSRSIAYKCRRAYARSQFWDRLGSAANTLGEKAYAATRKAGTVIASGTIKAGKYAGQVIKDDMTYHKNIREKAAKKRSARIAFARRNKLRMDTRPGYDDVYYTMSGIPIVVDVLNPDEVKKAESDLRGHLLGGGYSPYVGGIGSGRERIIIIQR